MDIWQTARQSNEYISPDGSRYLIIVRSCESSYSGLEIETHEPGLKGKAESLALTDPRKLLKSSNEKYFRQIDESHQHGEAAADYLYKTLTETLNSADYIYEQSRKFRTTEMYPASPLGKHLKTIASLILSDINTKVYYVSLGSFDTHINQQAQQKRYLQTDEAWKPV